jgi:uncharacterized protein
VRCVGVFSGAMRVSRIFVNNQGLRAGWRILIWFVIAYELNQGLWFVISKMAPGVNDPPFLRPQIMVIGGIEFAVAVLIPTLIMARIEHRRLRDYFIPTRDFFGRQFWQGLLWGFLAVSLLIGLIAAFHGYHITGLAIHGSVLAGFIPLWFAGTLVGGAAEELYYRSYMLRALADGIWFWPAAFVLSIYFGADHYFYKPHERWEDFACTGLLGLFQCLTVWRTGSLRFAIGFHGAFNWGAMFFYSGRNGGEFGVDHMFQTSWTGPDWLTGGLLGPEASRLVFIVIALLFLLFSGVYRPQRASAAPRETQ